MLGVALALALAAPASALDRYVRPAADPTCAGGGPAPCYTSITGAVAPGQAASGDVIHVGYNGGQPYQETVEFGGRTDLTIVGDPGPRPILEALAVNDAPALSIAAGADRTTLAHLQLNASSADPAVQTGATVTGTRIVDVGATCTAFAECLRMQGPSPQITDTSVTATAGAAIRLYAGGSLLRVATTGADVSIAALSPTDPASVRESSFSASASGPGVLQLTGAAGTVDRTRVASDSWTAAVQIQGNGADWTITNSLLTAAESGSQALDLVGNVTATLRNVTIVTPGYATGLLSLSPFPTTLNATNTILRGDLGDVYVIPGSTSQPTLAISDSAFRGIARGSASGIGSGTGNTSADPLFAGVADFHLSAVSPLIDAGGPVPAGDRDLDGIARPRSVRPDIGAYESPYSIPALSPPPPPVAQPQPPPGPQLLSLSLKPRTFRAAASGPSVKPGSTKATGSIVTFRLSVDARVTFTASKRTAGVRSNGRCVKRAKGRKGRSCTRYVPQAGSFARNAKRGTNTLRFTGRLSNRRLPRGTYRLRGTPRAGNAAGPVRDAAFTIKR